MKINVIPAEGFTVRDHNGRAIPKDGGQVELSSAVKARIREGMLIQVDELSPSAPEGGTAGSDDPETDVTKMKRDELADLLGQHDIEFDPKATKPTLLALVKEHLEAAE